MQSILYFGIVNKRKADGYMRKMVLSVLVDNTSGALNRIAGLFSRRGYNIDSLTVGETENPNLSRMTIVVRGDEEILEQIFKQISKLVDVREVIELKDESSVTRELILMKVAVDKTSRAQVLAVCDIFRAKIVDVSTDSLIIELTGNQAKLDAFIGLIQGFEVLELVRTGITGLTRGTN